MASNTMNLSAAPHRKLPILSRILIFPLHLMSAICHILTKPLGIEPAVSLLITGGFFGLVVVPICFFGFIFYLIEESGLYHDELNFTAYLGIPFAVLYFVRVLLLDKDHLSVERAAPIPPQNIIERLAHKFYDAGQDYNPIACVPWSKDVTLSTQRQYVFAVHPHGINCMPLSLFTTYGSDFDKQFPGLVGHKITGLAATVILIYD